MQHILEGDGKYNSQFAEFPITLFAPPFIGCVLTVPSDATIRAAVQMLSERNFTCAPVTDAARADEHSLKWQEKYLGIVDTTGLVVFMLDFMKHCTGDSFAKEYALITAFDQHTVAEMTTRAFWAPFVCLDETSTLLDCMLLMGQYGLHRLPVIDRILTNGRETLTNIITQRAVLGLLQRHMHRFTEMTYKSLRELGFGDTKPIISIEETRPAWQAFELLVEKRVSGVPVVNSSGQIVGNVSARDAVSLVKDPSLFRLIRSPLRDWLCSDYLEVITCVSTDSLSNVIDRLLEAGVHRIYMVDELLKPVRVISIRDILARFVKEPSLDYCGKFFASHGRGDYEGIRASTTLQQSESN